MSRQIALLSALGAGFALYNKSYLAGASFALITYVALSSVKELPKERLGRKLQRSTSAPELTPPSTSASIRSIELSSSPQVLPPPLKVEALSPKSSRRRSAPGRGEWTIDLSKLPDTTTHPLGELFSKTKEWLFGGRSKKGGAEIVHEVIDLRRVKGRPFRCIWDRFFPQESPLSLEIGDIRGAAARTRRRGGEWVVITSNESIAREVAQERDEAPFHKPLILLMADYGDLSLRNQRVVRIEFRNFGREPMFCRCNWVATALEEGGELCLISNRIMKSRFSLYLSPGANFEDEFPLPPTFKEVDEVILERGLLGPKEVISRQCHESYIFKGAKEIE